MSDHMSTGHNRGFEIGKIRGSELDNLIFTLHHIGTAVPEFGGGVSFLYSQAHYLPVF